MRHSAACLYACATAVARLDARAGISTCAGWQVASPPARPVPTTLNLPASRPLIDIGAVDSEGATLFYVYESNCESVGPKACAHPTGQRAVPGGAPCMGCQPTAGPRQPSLPPPDPPLVRRRPQDARGPARVQRAPHRVSSPACAHTAALTNPATRTKHKPGVAPRRLCATLRCCVAPSAVLVRTGLSGGPNNGRWK